MTTCNRLILQDESWKKEKATPGSVEEKAASEEKAFCRVRPNRTLRG